VKSRNSRAVRGQKRRGGNCDHSGDMSHQETREGGQQETLMTQHPTADDKICDTRSNSLDLTQQMECEKCVVLSPVGSVLELSSRQ
jgi:hypothetical protein